MLPSVTDILNSRPIEAKYADLLRSYVIEHNWEAATPDLIVYLKIFESKELNPNFKAKFKLIISSIQDILQSSQEITSLNERDIEYVGFVDLKPVLETEGLYY